MPYENQSPIAALVGGFGRAFSETHNRRIQQALAIKAGQDAQMAEVATKSLLEEPELAGNAKFMKFFGDVAGKENAEGIAEVAAAFAASPIGVLKKGLGAANLTRPDVPPEGPVFDPRAPGANPEAIAAVVKPRLAEQTPVETGLGFGVGEGQLQRDTQASQRELANIDPETGLTPAEFAKYQIAARNATTREKAVALQQILGERRVAAQERGVDLRERSVDLQEEGLTQRQLDALDRRELAERGLDLRERGLAEQTKRADRDFKLKEKGEGRRQVSQLKDLLLGETQVRQTPVGERMVIRRVDPATGQVYVTPVGGVKQAAPVGEVQKVMRTVNQGLIIADSLDTMARSKPQEVAALFKPFVGKKLADLENQLGSFSGFQKKFLLKLFELRNLRIREQGGASLTENETTLYNDVLPSNLNTLVTMAGAAIEHSIENLTQIGAVTEATTEQARSAPIRTRIVSPRQRDYYKLLRESSKHSFRDRAQIPLLPGEVLDDGSGARQATGTPSVLPSAESELESFEKLGL